MDKMDKKQKKPMNRHGQKEEDMRMSGQDGVGRSHHDGWGQTRDGRQQSPDESSFNAKRSR